MQIPSISMFCISPSDHGCWSAGIVAVFMYFVSAGAFLYKIPISKYVVSGAFDLSRTCYE